MTTLVVYPVTRPLAGSVPVPGDAEIALRAVIFAALARGDTHLAGLPSGETLASFARCLRSLGVAIHEASTSAWTIEGVGTKVVSAPAVDLDCGDSPSSAGILCAWLAGEHFRATVTGGAALRRADLASLVAPLRLRGAVVTGARGGPDTTVHAPLTIGPLAEGRTLSPLEHESEVADPNVKTALLLSGLRADGPTIFREPRVSADHTERMLATLGAPIRTIGSVVRLDPGEATGPWSAFRMTVPGDPAAAAYLVAAAQVVPGSRVTIRGVSTNPTRAGFLELARALGAGVEVESHGEEMGEPLADLHAWHAEPRAATLGDEPLDRVGDALAAACVIAAVASGTTAIRASEATAETLAAMALALRRFGVECIDDAGRMTVGGRGPRVSAADVDSGGDARIAMAACVLALAGSGPSRIRDAGSIAARFPKFVATLRALGARIDVEAR